MGRCFLSSLLVRFFQFKSAFFSELFIHLHSASGAIIHTSETKLRTLTRTWALTFSKLPTESSDFQWKFQAVLKQVCTVCLMASTVSRSDMMRHMYTNFGYTKLELFGIFLIFDEVYVAKHSSRLSFLKKKHFHLFENWVLAELPR